MKRAPRRVVLASVAGLALAAAAPSVADSSVPRPAHHASAGTRKRPRGYIVPEERGFEYLVRGAKRWTPSQAEVDLLEARLPASLRATAVAPELAAYGRLYLGFLDGGARQILVMLVSPDVPLEAMLRPRGPGPACRAIYDVATAVFPDVACPAR